MLHFSVFGRVGEPTIFSHIPIVPRSGAVLFLLIPVDCSFFVFIESANIRDIAIVVIINIVISWVVSDVVLVVHPGLIYIYIQHHNVSVEQVVGGVVWRD